MKRKLLSETYLREAEKYQIKMYMDEKNYYISVKKLIHLTEKFIIRNNIIAMDDGYYVIEIVPKKGNTALRIFLNEKKEPIEYYFDIIKESGIDKKTKIPYFDDMYLDVVYFPSGEIHIIDEDELEEALNQEEITREEYLMVQKEKDKLCQEIKQNTNSLLKINYQKYLQNL